VTAGSRDDRSELTLADLADRVDRQQALITRLLEKIDGLRDGASRPTARTVGPPPGPPQQGSPSDHEPGETPPTPGAGRVSRRGALRALGGVAAGGVGMAIGSAVLGVQPAAAANGDNLVLGQGNSASAETDLTTGGSGSGLSVVLGGTSGVGPGPAALVGDSSTQAGIVGASSAGDGVDGYTTADGFAGVSGTDTSPTGGNGVSGVSVAGTGVSGTTFGDYQSGVSGMEKAPVAAPGSPAVPTTAPGSSARPPAVTASTCARARMVPRVCRGTT